MVGRVGKKGAVNSEVKLPVKKGGAAKAVGSRAVKEQPEAKKRVAYSVGKTALLEKPGAGKHVHELQVRQAELERQNEDLRRAQEQLRASQDRYFDLYDIAPVGYFSISEKGVILEVNITGANMLGAVPSDMRAQRFSNFIFEEDLDIYNQHRTQLFETRLPQACEMRMVRRDGAPIWVLVEAIVAKDARSGKLICLATMNDITSQKRADEALRSEHNLAQSYLDTVLTIIVALDSEGKITTINRTGCLIFGRGEDELIGQNWFSSCLTQPFGMEKVYPIFLKLMSGELEAAEYFENPIITRIGETRQIAWHNALLRDEQGRITGTLSSGEDITERKKMEEALRASEEKYHLLADNTADGIWLLDMDLKLIYCSPSSQKQSGFTLQEITEMSLEQYFTPESLTVVTEAFLEEIPKVLADPDYNPILTLELAFYKKDGTDFWAESKFSIIRNKSGKPESILGVARDITERKIIEAEVRESEEKYRNLFDNASEAIFVAKAGKVVFLNPRTSRMIGQSVEDILKKPFTEFIHPDDRQLVIDRHLKRLKGEVLPDQYEFRIIHENGAPRWVQLNTVVITWEGQPATLNFLEDTTERKLAEEYLTKSYESLKKTLNDSINTMVKIVELRDPYTAGHQQKVAELATAIARTMKLDDIRIDQLRMAAVTHDIGKMYVPSDILSKPGRLSNIEFSLIKTHSQSGYNIVKGMDFPGSVADTILQHHERLDGSGYPYGLKGKDMLLEAKILAVADVVEAMASHRPYRSALGIDKALEEISNNSGKLYDPDAVDACLELFRKEQFEFKPV